MTTRIGWTKEKYRRKIDQAWELAGCARVDGDKTDEARWTSEARTLSKELGELIRAGVM